MQKIFRVMIIIAMLITAYLMVLAWQEDYGNKPVQQAATKTIASSSDSDFNATATVAETDGDFPTPVAPATQAATVTSAPSTQFINISTDMYDIKIDPKGGDVIYAALKQYNATLDSKESFVLLENNDIRTYIAQSEIINLAKTESKRTEYSVTSNNFTMADSQDTLKVPLTYTEDGVTITKTFTFNKGKYPINVSYDIDNASSKPWQGQMFAQLKRDDSKDPGMEDKGPLSMATYMGGAWGTPEQDYNKLAFKDFNPSEKDAKDLNSTVSEKAWVAIVQHYFVSAWTPTNFKGQFFSKEKNGNYLIGFNSQPIIVNQGTKQTLSATLYAGPKVQEDLAEVATGMKKTVDYGVLWPISKVLFALLEMMHNVLGNWGWAIIGLTLLVKLALMWMAGKGYYSMAKMRAIAPKLQALKEEHGEDRMAMSQAMMKLYKDEKVSPMAGCMPMLLQMPIFLALYWVLVESVELRHAPWILWINDLASMDSLFILPALMGASMFIQQMLNPQPPDPMQAKVMKILPIVFTVMMMFFPAGLVLYWTVNNIFSMSQQYYINKKVEKEYAEREAAQA